jgi:hypothetical protein
MLHGGELLKYSSLKVQRFYQRHTPIKKTVQIIPLTKAGRRFVTFFRLHSGWSLFDPARAAFICVNIKRFMLKHNAPFSRCQSGWIVNFAQAN